MTLLLMTVLMSSLPQASLWMAALADGGCPNDDDSSGGDGNARGAHDSGVTQPAATERRHKNTPGPSTPAIICNLKPIIRRCGRQTKGYGRAARTPQ